MKKLVLMMTLSALLSSCGSDQMPQVVLPEIDTSNPLLAEWDTRYATPPFDKIKISDYEPAFETAIAVSRAEIDAIVNNPAKPTFKNTIVAMERQGELLGRISGIFYNLREADTSDEMDAIAMRIQPKMTELSNDISLNPELFARVKAVYEGSRRGLSDVDIKLLEETYKGFARSGAELSDEKKEEYRKYSSSLASSTLLFGQNSLSATNAFAINITDPKKVAELPDFVKEGMAAEAKARGEKGWSVTLKAPSYIPFMTYSSQRDLKEKLYRAYNSRALGGEFDNTQVIKNIISDRLAIASLLGYKTYADYVLEDKMAESSENVNNFLSELRDQTLEYGRKDYAMINEFVKQNGLKGDVMPWDWAYYTEKYKSEKYAINDEQVKPYLKLDNVIKGVFLLAEKLYGLSFVPNKDIQVYHPDVTAYEVYDKDVNGKRELLSILYLDFFPRESKRSGAWMTEFRGAKVVNGEETRPLVSLVMNFTKPTETMPSLLTFDEFETFLHEFGHALHGMLAKGGYESMNGTAVYRDFVELPSQIMENWATEKEYLDMWAVHYQTGEKIPAELIEKIVAAKNYLAAYLNLRQLSFGISDMKWHMLTDKSQIEALDIETFEREAVTSVQITPLVEGTSMAPAFTHIFSGGYAAGYYGYKWAEVLAADAYSLFQEKGIFDAQTASKFRHLLEQGGQRHPMDIYVEFRGHKPETKALIESMGLK
ncbi:MAG: M3 family metallopeptidase [Alistipes sp.]|nr:M3 family metallopeptidase [Alistipes sp.]